MGDRNSGAFWRSSCRLAPTQPPGSRLPTLRSPTRFGVQFKLVRFYYVQRRAGRPRSSPRRFAAIVGYADIWRFGFASTGDATARRSVAYLVLLMRFLLW
ncbi:MAG: hypothetical protein LBQ66_15165 [Planctomycetaceae bacterium]|nr:hypothetical protein [Planctomycetaceae bacterium]